MFQKDYFIVNFSFSQVKTGEQRIKRTITKYNVSIFFSPICNLFNHLFSDVIKINTGFQGLHTLLFFRDTIKLSVLKQLRACLVKIKGNVCIYTLTSYIEYPFIITYSCLQARFTTRRYHFDFRNKIF